MTRKADRAARIRRWERTNREFWDTDADDYQAAHASQLGATEPGWGVWQIPERELRVLGEVAGRDVLELGCGGAQWSIHVARAGARLVGLDQSGEQLRHARRLVRAAGSVVRLVQATAIALPFASGSFDIVFCDHGAMSFCEPEQTVPEVARVLRAGGLLAFSTSTLLRHACFPPDDPDAPITRRLHRPFFGSRVFDWGEGTVDFLLRPGEWIRLLRRHEFEVEDLLELRPPKGATTTYDGFADREWARRWPAEEIWRARRR